MTRIWVEYHVFAVTDHHRWDYQGTREWPNRVTVQEPGGGIEIYTGIHTGHVHVTAALTTTPPDVVTDGWEVVGETSVRSVDGSLAVRDRSDELSTLPNGSKGWVSIPLADGPGWYRIRISARGRDSHYDGANFDSGEVFHITAWPEPDRREDISLHATDKRVKRTRPVVTSRRHLLLATQSA